jgi:hypothetical protein
VKLLPTRLPEAGVEDLALRSRVQSSSRPPAAHAGDPTHDEHRTGHNPRPEDPGIPVDLQSSGGRVQCTLTDHGNGHDPPSPATSRPRTRARPAPGWLAGYTVDRISSARTPDGFTVRLATAPAAVATPANRAEPEPCKTPGVPA